MLKDWRTNYVTKTSWLCSCLECAERLEDDLRHKDFMVVLVFRVC